VVVIGGGVVGAGAAYRLVQGGGARVTVVDRADAGHATAAGAGIVAPAIFDDRPAEWFPLAFRAVAHYEELLAQLSDDGERDTGYEQVGALVLATNEPELLRLDASESMLRRRRADGVPNVGDVDRVTAAEARELFPPLREDLEAVHVSGAARVDGRKLRESLLRAVERHGGAVIPGDATLVAEAGGVQGVEVDGRRVAADAVIAACGAWAEADGIRPQRGQIVHLAQPGADTTRWPIVTGFRDHYLLTFPGDRVVAGATREDGVGFDYRVTAGGLRQVLTDALDFAPGLAVAGIVEMRVGFRPTTRDFLPLLGASPSVDALWIANGLGPYGLMMGPYAGALVADLVLGRPPPLDVTAYRPGRPSVVHDPDRPDR